MKPFPIPVVGLGPGSQPEDPDLSYMPLPREIEGFDMPYLPTAEEVTNLAAAKQVMADLITALKAYDGDASQYPVLDITHLDSENRALINQLLGEGEVSAMTKPVAGGELRIQESVFAGIWRVLEEDGQGNVIADRIEACPIPHQVWQEAQAFGRAEAVMPDPGNVPLMNAGYVMQEIAAKLSQPLGMEPHIINFSLLPMSPEDMAYIDSCLGGGNSGVFSRGYGKCRVMSTALKNVWKVQYFNGMNSILLDTIEITRIPEVALASMEDLEDSLLRLEEAYEWLTGE
ncbi:hydrogenase expression/formation protein [Leeia sp. TBRC 13508]|uniref:Hydrogenase expression/formation protein n=1 Tax=Leeia speluncae TaxID=2884804 RepID=A0ABS8D307_9NEIS|nr:hydrogenase expression/formation protein [Leeia speluncae]MCB6182383.1 hydrogenase expression/formation protein [Leeia speluncae]